MSIKNSLIYHFLKFYKHNKILKNVIDKGFISKLNKPFPPKSMYKKYHIQTYQILYNTNHLITPKGKVRDVSILYFHGGGYINDLFSTHWRFFKEIINKTSVSLTAVRYPLAPNSNHKDVFDSSTLTYLDWIQRNEGKKLILMGDSAGGGLALALAMWARDNNYTKVNQLILISPWLDVSMSNLTIKKVDRKDPLLSVDDLKKAGLWFASKESVKDPYISPIYGKHNDLPNISLFTGTADILYPDIDLFSKKIKPDKIKYYVYEKMIHDFVLFKTVESVVASEDIISEVTKEI
ncbi:MAG: alpha/beta hydrolase [Acholeplasmatales bacterium]|jgi:acetyl esterase/lipase|nr:alpha/beta hydrolase [Acholeplasmatales bacterium]